MLKGCTKRIIVIKDTGSDLFEEAIFFLKPEKEKSMKLKSEHDFITEANKLISSKSLCGFANGAVVCNAETKNKLQKSIEYKKREVKIFFSGAAIASIGAVILSILL